MMQRSHVASLQARRIKAGRIRLLVAAIVEDLIANDIPRRRWIAAVEKDLARFRVTRSPRQIARDIEKIVFTNGDIGAETAGRIEPHELDHG